MCKITYEFDSYEDKEEHRLFQGADKMFFALDEIYNLARAKYKYSEEEISADFETFLEKVMELSYIVFELDH